MATEAEIKEKMQKVHWVPLESNPEVLNAFAYKVGLPKTWGFTDIFGLDPELLMMVPQPCKAVTLLFQCTENISKFKAAQKEELEKSGQTVSKDLFYMRQYVGNACGTIAACHSIGNSAEELGVPGDSALGKFLADAKGKTPEESGAMLADANQLHSASEESAQGGQTEAPDATARTDHHFICFVEKDGDLYELDGGKFAPINHGPTAGEFLAAAAQVIQGKFMATDPDSIHFNMMALSKLD